MAHRSPDALLDLHSSRRRRTRIRSTGMLLPITIYVLATLSFAHAFSSNHVQPANGHSSRQGHQLLSSSASPRIQTCKRLPTVRHAESISTRQVVGDWEELHGNFLLRPSVEAGPPRALIHFLGGAIVGASPHITYRYMLERLAEKGFLVIATPYDLSFDHLSTCDAVISRFERIASLLAQTYGALPVVGVGHSCGALLQLLITSLFPDTPRAANALISYNNKPVSDAIPLFDEVFAPLFTYAAARNDPNRHSGSKIISVGLDLAKAAAIGQVPSDDLLSEAARLVVPPAFSNTESGDRQRIAVPKELRDLFQSFASPVTTALSESGFTSIVSETFDTLQQVPKLIDEVADGARDFVPPPALVKSMTRKAYRARRTLILQYMEDPIDESNELEELLNAAGQIIRNKRPMIQIDVQKRQLAGGHAAPLLAPPLDLATRAETVLGVEAAKENLRYKEADQTVEELSRWLEDANL
ncbi:hypothetical protein MPSEU_000388800 [Mayamaea pseudoterrestris]|nr:hypothetical protein MPSEU_000388800 [Mayamaea pseudoterrestris]